MNYIGSKYSLLPFLEKVILAFAGPETERTFLDLFAGTGAVGQHFKRLGFRIVANDIQYYSYCLNRAHVGVNAPPKFAGLAGLWPQLRELPPADRWDSVLNHLHGLTGVPGFLYRHYCPGGTAGTAHPRRYFTDENGQRGDAIRQQLERWYADGLVTEDEYFVLLAGLIEALDRVANTASVYGAFLKQFKKSARRPLRLERCEIVPSDKPHQVYHGDGSTLIDQVACDILYLDPPYNQRQYGTNYHVLETIARYDDPVLYGVTGLRDYTEQKSAFCYRGQVLAAFEDLLRRTIARYVFLSYNSEGLMSADEVVATMARYGRVQVEEQDYRRFRADNDGAQRRYRGDAVIEYLFCLEKEACIFPGDVL